MDDLSGWIELSDVSDDYDELVPKAVVRVKNPPNRLWTEGYINGRSICSLLLHGFVKSTKFLGRLGDWDPYVLRHCVLRAH